MAGDRIDRIATSSDDITFTLSSNDVRKARNWPFVLAWVKIPMEEMSRSDALPLNSGFSSCDHLPIGRPIRSGRMPSVSAL